MQTGISADTPSEVAQLSIPDYGPLGFVCHTPEVDQIVYAGDKIPKHLCLNAFREADREETETVTIITVDIHVCSPLLLV